MTRLTDYQANASRTADVAEKTRYTQAATHDMSAPRKIRALTEAGELELTWSDEAVDCLPFRFLRGRCPCAECVDEFTNVRIVDVDDVPEDVHPKSMQTSGNYALKIRWSDEHDTGLFTWERLRRLGEENRS